MDRLRWVLAGVGILIIALIYLWGMRARIKEQLRERRRRLARLSEDNEPALQVDQPEETAENVTEFEFGHLGKVSPNHHLADKILVDVEITPVNRSEPQPASIDEKALKSRETPKIRPEPPHQKPIEQAPEQPQQVALETPQMTVLLTVMAPQGQFFRGSRVAEVAGELDLKLATSGIFDCFSPGKAQKPVFSVGHLREPGTFDLTTLEILSTPGLLLFMQLPGPLEAMAAVDFMLGMAKRLAQRLDGIVCDERRNKMTNQSMDHLRSKAAEFERRLRLQQPRH